MFIMKKPIPFNQNLFANLSAVVLYNVSRNQTVKADYFSLDNEKARAIKGRKTTDKNGEEYIQLQVIDQSVQPNTYYRGALFVNKDKVEGSTQPDYTGSLDLHDEGEEPTRMNLSAWLKEKPGGKAGKYLSISAQERLSGEQLAEYRANKAAGAPNLAAADDTGSDATADDPFAATVN